MREMFTLQFGKNYLLGRSLRLKCPFGTLSSIRVPSFKALVQKLLPQRRRNTV